MPGDRMTSKEAMAVLNRLVEENPELVKEWMRTPTEKDTGKYMVVSHDPNFPRNLCVSVGVDTYLGPTHFVPKREAQHAAELAGYLAREAKHADMDRCARNIAFALGLVAALRCYHAGHDRGRPRALLDAGLWQERIPTTPGADDSEQGGAR